MSRKRLFVENIFAYGFITMLNKVVPFLLLPIITRMLPNTSDFGIYNMYSVIVGFGTPFAIMGLYDAMFREYFEKDDQQYKYDVTTTAQRLILLSSMVISVILVVFNKSLSYLFFGTATHNNIVVLAGIGIFLGANRSPIQAPTRMQNERKVFLVSGLINSIVMYGLSLFLIYKGFSYFGLIYSNIVTVFIMIIFFSIRNNKFFTKGSFDKNIAKELFKIGLPLLPTFLTYWVYNSMDKIMIANMLDTNQLGIYSIGSKMAQVSQLIYAGFAGGFSYYKYKTMKDADQVEMNSKLVEYLGIISFCSYIVVFPFIKPTFMLLFDGAYEQGYIVSPYLFLSPLLLMLFQVIGSQFTIVKKTYITSITLFCGALCNVTLNYFLIKHIGIEGAAIATLIGYIVSLIVVSVIAYRYKLLLLKKRVILIAVLTIAYTIFNRVLYPDNFILNLVSATFVIAIVVIQYFNELKGVLNYKGKKTV